MSYQGRLPELHELAMIAESVRSYPVSLEELIEHARRLGFEQDVQDFIGLFRDKQPAKFQSRADFYIRSADLALLIYEERHQPKEGFLGPLE